MKDRLIITNGDEAVARMREARIDGEILPWRDILYEGPVPSLPLDELSDVRARFLAQRGWTSEEELRAAFRARDDVLRGHAEFREIVLWFEHDLYDQLQLVQVLDFLAGEGRREGVSLIQSGRYIGTETPRGLKPHLHLQERATEAHFALAWLTWNAFRAPSPEPWANLLRLSTHVLPFLRLAILRLLEELPDHRTGLSRTETTILTLIHDGVRHPAYVYDAYRESEVALFMGDWSFYCLLDALGDTSAPFIAGLNGRAFSPGLPEGARDDYMASRLSLTHLGVSVLSGHADALQHRRIDRAIGGVRITSRAPWRWDGDARRLVPPESKLLG
ncbi:hypothetical protein T281_04410 [Rhodomicrobium udaipurense JA643]|uniref:DUF1835 domain-containing protein n=1 Tax=Rhodomicrobium udaipurense TaxID=1202716 RepID=A0A8I1KJN5_9HYPH|nr:DUF1835 domain-containing protein [Rhodomicrobium udaipurense]KAI95648.1 hypothetical protein T281_04410 [Rhodomicrobium udaipurense JA643]MBJ7543084.1 DUF1835 domain-containing protein [Rhodomicrobium udaipurense]